MKKERSYIESVYHYGNIWNLSIAGILLMSPVLVCIIFQVLPDWNALLKGLIATAPMYVAVGIIETFTYIPMLGAGGSYLSFVTGNISNLKLPCALNALSQSGYEVTSEEGEIISTISIAVSSIVTTLVVALGVLLIVPLRPILESPVLDPAFKQMLPALFGGLGVVFIAKNWKIAIAPIILMLILFISIPALNEGTVGIMVPVSAVFTIIFTRILYNKGLLGEKGGPKVVAVNADVQSEDAQNNIVQEQTVDNEIKEENTEDNSENK